MHHPIDICASERCGTADFALIAGNISYRVQKSRIKDMFSTTGHNLKYKRSFTLPEDEIVGINAAAFEMYLRALHHRDRIMRLPPHTMLSLKLLQGIAKVCVRYGGEELVPENFKSALIMPELDASTQDDDYLPLLVLACKRGWWDEVKVLFREVVQHVSRDGEGRYVYRYFDLLDEAGVSENLQKALIQARNLVLEAHMLTSSTHCFNLRARKIALSGSCNLHAQQNCSERLYLDFSDTYREAVDNHRESGVFWDEPEYVPVSLNSILRVYREKAKENEGDGAEYGCADAGWHERNLVQLIKGCAVPVDILKSGRNF